MSFPSVIKPGTAAASSVRGALRRRSGPVGQNDLRRYRFDLLAEAIIIQCQQRIVLSLEELQSAQ
jgi:hypothetical protein